MEKARFNAALGNILCEIDRRCVELTHPIPDDWKKVAKKLRKMEEILEHTNDAMACIVQQGGDVQMLETVVEIINKIRIKDYADEKAEAEGGATP